MTAVKDLVAFLADNINFLEVIGLSLSSNGQYLKFWRNNQHPPVKGFDRSQNNVFGVMHIHVIYPCISMTQKSQILFFGLIPAGFLSSYYLQVVAMSVERMQIPGLTGQ
jgi:hypothetical protein